VYEGSEVRLGVRLMGMSVCAFLNPGNFLDVGWGLGGDLGGVGEWGRRCAYEGLIPASG
jgi:hypothetical protein